MQPASHGGGIKMAASQLQGRGRNAPVKSWAFAEGLSPLSGCVQCSLVPCYYHTQNMMVGLSVWTGRQKEVKWETGATVNGR